MVQVIPRQTKEKGRALKKYLPWASLILVALVLIVFFLLVASIKNGKSVLADVNTELEAAQTQESLESALEIQDYRKKINNALQILSQRRRALEFFAFLEEFVHPDIYFTSVALDLELGDVVISGIAKDFETIGKQVNIFKAQEYTFDADIVSVSLTELEGIEFSIEVLLFKPEEK